MRLLPDFMTISRAGARIAMTAMIGVSVVCAFAATPAVAQSAAPKAAMADKAPTDKGYVLGIDDAVDITVYTAPEASVKTRIKADGTIVMPLIGAIPAASQTAISLAALITRKLESGNFFKSPIVNIEILAYSSRSVNVAGKVGQPSIIPLDKPYRVLEVLLKSGWVAGGAQYVYLRRAADSKEIRLDVEGLVRGGPDKNPYVESGDSLFVPDAEVFFISGQIARSGALPITPGMTLRQAIALAGGVTASGNERKVALFRPGAKEVDAELDQLIQKNDVFVVKERLF